MAAVIKLSIPQEWLIALGKPYCHNGCDPQKYKRAAPSSGAGAGDVLESWQELWTLMQMKNNGLRDHLHQVWQCYDDESRESQQLSGRKL
jgi:hypothetical protein